MGRLAVSFVLLGLLGCTRTVDRTGDGVTPTPDAGAPDTGAPDTNVPDHPPAADAPPPDSGDPDGVGLRERCFPGLGDPSKGLPDYDQYRPTVGAHCLGTNHQAITGVEKLVFLGDSVTEGTPPTPESQFYRTLVTEGVRARFGEVEVVNCSAWGARTDDLLDPPHQQVQTCVGDVEPKRTLVVMTMGGNDMANYAKDGLSSDEAITKVDGAVALFEAAVKYLKDPAHFPNGSYVIFANVYEYTDGTGELLSCPQAFLAGYFGSWAQGRAAYMHINEEYMRVAKETGSDMVFMLEHFCGHGFKAGDSSNECYRGPDAETWFDLTCIHPNPTGHAELANMFLSVIDE